MFKLFQSQKTKLVEHRYQNLVISLPAYWVYEFEEGGQEACYDPKSQSTLRLNIIKTIPPAGTINEENIASLTENQPYVTTAKGYLLTKPTYAQSTDSNQEITLITWRLIDNSNEEKTITVLSYTVLSAEKDSAQEKDIFNLIKGSLQTAEFLNE